MGQYDRRTAQAVLGLNVAYVIYPVTTGVPAVGVVNTTGAGAWGAQADIVAALAIATEFWICGFMLDTAGVAQIFETQVSDATPTVLTEFRIDPTAVTVNIGYIPAGTYPINMAAGSQVQARSGGAAAKVLGITALIATGL